MKKCYAILLALPLLIGCGSSTKGSSINSSEDNSSSFTPSSSEVGPDWTDEEKNVFKNNLYGYVVPYCPLDGNHVYYAPSDKAIYVSGAPCHQEDLLSYYQALINDGFVSYYSEYNYYYLEKPLSTSEGTRFLCANLFAYDSSGYSVETGEGYFALMLHDDYFYEWPTQEVADRVQMLNESTKTVIPSFNADYYYFFDEELSLGRALLGCFTDDSNSMDIYTNTLTNANWTILPQEDGVKYKTAISPDEQMQIDYQYIEELEEFDIYYSNYYKPEPWPSEEINNNLQLIVPGTTTEIPQLPAASYQINYYPLYSEMCIHCIYAKEGILNKYVSDLENTDWDVKEDSYYSNWYECISPNKDVYLEVYENYAEIIINVTAYYDPKTIWPAQEIANLITREGGTGTILEPTYSDVLSYLVLDDSAGIGVVVYVPIGKEEEAASHYEQQVQDAGWTCVGDYYGSNIYKSPTSNVAVDLLIMEGSYTIEITVYSDNPYEGKTVQESLDIWKHRVGFDAVNMPILQFTHEVTYDDIDISENPDSYDGLYFDFNIYCDEANINDVFNELAQAFTNAGYDIEVYSTYGGGKDASEKVEAYFRINSDKQSIYVDIAEPLY